MCVPLWVQVYSINDRWNNIINDEKRDELKEFVGIHNKGGREQ